MLPHPEVRVQSARSTHRALATSARAVALSLAALAGAGPMGAKNAPAPPPGPGSQEVLALFREISRIPRGSGNEQGIAQWLLEWGAGRGWKAARGAGGNVFLRVPGTPGFEQAPGVVLQAHMDMVCDKESGSSHDFSKDPIVVEQQGEWLHARGTTLGADDGIGVALALSVAADPALAHPPLEILLTTSEEAGMVGAWALQPEDVDGRILINLDSEWDGICIGDWTGIGQKAMLVPETAPLAPGNALCSLRIQGLKGGHSGGDIGRRRANANKVLGRALAVILEPAGGQIVSAAGGTVTNAIPRSAEAVVAVPAGQVAGIRQALSALRAKVLEECPEETAAFTIALDPEPASRGGTALSREDAGRFVALLNALPCGVLGLDPRFPGFPETSVSVGVVRATGDLVTVSCLARGSNVAKLLQLNQDFEHLAGSHRATAQVGNPRQPWLTDPGSGLAKKSQAAYRELAGAPPRVYIAAGGLEVGVIAQKCPGLEAISIGPDIENPHGPGERVNIPSIGKTRALLAAILASCR